MATPVANSVPLTTYALVDGLVQGGSWQFSGGPQELTYELTTNTGTDGSGNPVGGTWQASAALATAVDAAFTAWSRVANLSFVSLGEGGTYAASGADIAVTLTGDSLSTILGVPTVVYAPDNVLGNAVRQSSLNQGTPYSTPEGDLFIDNAAAALASIAPGGLSLSIDPGGLGFTYLVREIGRALGLKLSADDGSNGRPTFDSLGIAQLDTAAYTIMSEAAIVGSGDLLFGNVATPMALDILAIQRIYGANTTAASGNDTYSLANDGIWRTVWDTAGTDTITAAASGSTGATIDLRPGAISSVGSSRIAVAYNVAIENAIGSAGADSIQGNELANTLTGGAGNDTIGGDAGVDIAQYTGTITQYAFVDYLGTLRIADRIASRDGVDQLIDVEVLRYNGDGRMLGVANVDSFSPLEYVASYTDLMNGFAANAALGYEHFVATGRFEGRDATFRGLDYVASYADLIAGFGVNGEAGATHYITSGRFEGRTVTFNALEYIASYPDLIVGFGANGNLGASHYITSGRLEGRTEHFNAAQYLANYADLQAGFGGNLELATIHYIQSGYFEGRNDAT